MKSLRTKSITLTLPAMVGALLLAPSAGFADTSYTILNTTADAFLATGSPGNPVGNNLTGLNFGGAGTLAIAPASSTKGEFDSIIKFNTAAAVSQFNTTYGVGKWQLTSVTLTLASNFGGQGEQPSQTIFNSINAGNFGIDWLGYDGWVEGNGGGTGTPGNASNGYVTYNSIPTLFSAGSVSLGTFHYAPPGDNNPLSYALPLNSSLVSDTDGGGDVSLYFYAADDNVSYLFNSRTYASNHPELTLTATMVPEPATWVLMSSALGGMLLSRRLKRKS